MTRDFKVIELMFSELLREVEPALSEAERLEVQRFLDVGEFGLALETAADIYGEEKRVPTSEVIALMEQLAVAMSIDFASILDRLHKS